MNGSKGSFEFISASEAPRDLLWGSCYLSSYLLPFTLLCSRLNWTILASMWSISTYKAVGINSKIPKFTCKLKAEKS